MPEKGRKHKWLDDYERSVLFRHYPEKETTWPGFRYLLPDRTPQSLQMLAWRMGIKACARDEAADGELIDLRPVIQLLLLACHKSKVDPKRAIVLLERRIAEMVATNLPMPGEAIPRKEPQEEHSDEA